MPLLHNLPRVTWPFQPSPTYDIVCLNDEDICTIIEEDRKETPANVSAWRWDTDEFARVMDLRPNAYILTTFRMIKYGTYEQFCTCLIECCGGDAYKFCAHCNVSQMMNSFFNYIRREHAEGRGLAFLRAKHELEMRNKL